MISAVTFTSVLLVEIHPHEFLEMIFFLILNFSFKKLCNVKHLFGLHSGLIILFVYLFILFHCRICAMKCLEIMRIINSLHRNEFCPHQDVKGM